MLPFSQKLDLIPTDDPTLRSKIKAEFRNELGLVIPVYKQVIEALTSELDLDNPPKILFPKVTHLLFEVQKAEFIWTNVLIKVTTKEDARYMFDGNLEELEHDLEILQ
jgi:hypothetical protein